MRTWFTFRQGQTEVAELQVPSGSCLQLPLLQWVGSCVQGLCATQQVLKVMLNIQHSAAQHRPGPTKVHCHMDHSHLDIHCCPHQDHYISPLGPPTVHLSQRCFKLQVILVNCLSKRKFMDRLDCYFCYEIPVHAAQLGMKHFRRFSYSGY